jgi:hypothetical protein
MAASGEGAKYVDWESLSASDKEKISPNQTVLETSQPEINRKTKKEAFEIARDSYLKDPFDKSSKAQEISLLALLGRELEESYHARSHRDDSDMAMHALAKITAQRLGSIPAIRALAEACRSEIHTQDLRDEYDEKKVERDTLIDATNSYASTVKIGQLNKEIQDLLEQITINERTGNEIYHYLTEVADDLEAKPGAWEGLVRE